VINYTLTRSARKTVAIYIKDGEVEVRAPHRVPMCWIDNFVLSKNNWIQKTLSKQQAIVERKITLTSDEIKHYKTLAKAHIPKRVALFAAQMGVAPTAVKITSAMKRWGSCSSRGSINFSWRLILADDAVIDYVVVHELAHLTEMNHSERFWAIVEAVLPDYRERKRKLNELQI